MKNIKKRFCCAFLSILIIISSLMLLTSCSSEKEETTSTSDSYYVSFSEGFTEEKIVDEASAIKAIESVASELGISDPEKELSITDVSTVDGDDFYRMQQYYNGIPVYGRTVSLAADEAGNAVALTANSTSIKDVETEATAEPKEIISSIEKYYDDENAVIDDVTNDKLYIYNLEDTEDSRLVYLLSVVTENGAYNTLVDAINAEVVDSCDAITYAQREFTYNGQKGEQTFYAESNNGLNQMVYTSKTGTQIKVFTPADDGKYTWYNATDSNIVTWQNGESPDESAVDLITNMTTAYEFFTQTFGRDSYDGNCSTINAYVHVEGYRNGDGEDRDVTNNAFHWQSPNGTVFAFTKRYDNNGQAIEEYSSDLDVVAHEYTHGIQRNIVVLDPEGESGALKEAYADIFGELVEANAIGEQPDWESEIRIIKDPHQNKNPASIGDEYFLSTENILKKDGSSSNDNGNVHNNSTVISYSAYLMWNGIDGAENKKISTENLAKLWYRAMHLLQSDATFKQCANAVIISAQQMYQNDPNNFTVEHLSCVKQAFDEVGIYSDISSSNTVTNGSTICAVERDGSTAYDNYHLTIEKIDLSTRSVEKVDEVDIDDKNGYTIDLPEDTYVVTVTDNAENGSEYKYSKTIRVIELLPGTNYPRAGQTQQPVTQKVYIYTDFKSKIPATDFTIPAEQVITLGELGVIEPEITPLDADGYSIKWSSSDESVATVSPTGEAGIITALSKGTTTITAELTSGGKTITKTTNLRVASKARDTVLVLDISGSMSGEPLEEMKKSAIQFCNDLLTDEYNNRVGLVFYDDEIYTIDLTDDLDMLISYIEDIDDGGLTNMEAGLTAADSMLQNYANDTAIKNVVVMADGLPNDGKTSDSGSMPISGYYSNYTDTEYANAVIDTAKVMMNNYNMYSLGFFHGLYGDSKDFAITLMQQLTNQTDGYYQVDKAEDLQFAFGDISDEISVGSKIVINIACPVDVTVTYEGEKLSSSETDYCDAASFGTLQLLGENNDIKVFSLDSDKDYEVEVVGTGNGTMDYSVNYYDETEQLTDYRTFESVPITTTTVIHSDTDNSTEDISLYIDEDNDGETDTVWTAGKKSKGVISYEDEPAVAEEPVEEEEDGLPAWAIVLIVVMSVVVIGSLTVVVIVVSQQRGKEIATDHHIPVRVQYEQPPVEMNDHKRTEDDTRKTGVIKVTSGSMTGFAVPIKDGETLYLGKDTKIANIVFTKDYRNVSRMHCSVTFDAKANKYYVIDSSSNGTYFISKRRLIKGQRTPVNVNTVLMLANEDCTISLG